MLIIKYELFVLLPITYFGIILNYNNLSIKFKFNKTKLNLLKYFIVFLIILSIFWFIRTNDYKIFRFYISIFLLKFLFILFFVSIPEELFFRGVLTNWFLNINKRYKLLDKNKLTVIVVVITTFLFFLLHYNYNTNMSFYYGLFIGVYGIVSGYIYVRTRSLFYTIILNIIFMLFC